MVVTGQDCHSYSDTRALNLEMNVTWLLLGISKHCRQVHGLICAWVYAWEALVLCLIVSQVDVIYMQSFLEQGLPKFFFFFFLHVKDLHMQTLDVGVSSKKRFNMKL